MANGRPSLGLALGGGGARGLAHVPVLEALDALRVRPAAVSGTSIGAILGAAYASGMTGAEIRAVCVETFRHRRVVVGRLWRTRPPSLSAFLAEGGLRFGQLNAARVLQAFLPHGLPRRFEDLPIPLTVFATDYWRGEAVAIASGDLVEALAASAALPALFRPVEREGRLLVDGGLVEPLPYEALLGRTTHVVAVDVTGAVKAETRTVPPPLQLMTGASQIMMASIIREKLKRRAPDLLLSPDVSDWGVLDFLRSSTILDGCAPVRAEAERRIAALLGLDGEETQDAALRSAPALPGAA